MNDKIISKKLQILQDMTIEFSRPIGGWQFQTADYLAVGKYKYDAPWANTGVPARFRAGKTVFLRAPVSVPASVPLTKAYLAFDFQDMEGLLTVDGKSYAGLDHPHPRVPAPRKGRLNIQIEFFSVPAVLFAPQLSSTLGIFSGGKLCVVNREIESFYYDVRFAWETARVISDPRRKSLLEMAIEAAMLAVDLTLPRARLLEDVTRARRILRERFLAIAPDPEAGRLYAVGHTHIDTAYLWPLRETVRKCGRTFATACRLMERYAKFHFACSQPQLYRYTKEHYPDVYRQIRKWVKAGRWETTGAMWVEADCNITGGESLIRQMLHGIHFFQKEFGTRPRTCWLPDVFGYPASLPGIIAGCGLKYFYTYKLHWQATNAFPWHLFRWRGIDGTEVFAHVVNHIGGYINQLTPEFLFKGWNLYAQKAEYPEVIFPFGHGDGGGGVTEEMMEMYQRAEGQFPGLPAVRTGPAEKYFDEMAAAHPALPVWDGELYVETHRGTYTTQSALKRANRTSELMLRDAEIFGSLATFAGRRFKASRLRQAWELTLLHQFHDILPGSSIGMVYEDALRDHARVQATARCVMAESLAAMAPRGKSRHDHTVCVFNSLSWPRKDIFTAEMPDRKKPIRSIMAPDGRKYPAQVVAGRNGKAAVVFQAGEVPPIGYAVFVLGNESVEVPDAKMLVAPTKIENRFFQIALNRSGGITRLWDKVNKRHVIVRGAVGNDLQLMQDGPEREDAWNIHDTNDKRHYPFEGESSVRVVETGPVRGVVRIRRAHRKSMIEQDIVVYRDLGRIDFVTRVDWQERQTMLKAAFPLEIRSMRATYEVQFGAYERPTHRNTSWDQQKFEVPGQRWADLSEAGYGVSLLNDSRYGYDAKGNVLRLTLLRSTTFPDPQADRGRHEFTYALLPHAGSWVEGETVRRAWEMNVPARTLPVKLSAHWPAVRSFITLEGAAAVVETLKPAEDGRGLILRIYEPHGGRGDVTVKLGIPVKKVRQCNLVEEDGAEVTVRQGAFRFAIRPFQICTLRMEMQD